MSTSPENASHDGGIRLLFGMLTGILLLTVSASNLFAQDEMPQSADDVDFARKLMAHDFPDLAVDILRRLEQQPGLDKEAKRDLGKMIVDAYMVLARKTPDAKERERYLAQAKQKLNRLREELGEEMMTPEMRYLWADLIQTEGRSLAALVNQAVDEKRKDELRREASTRFDESRKLFGEIAAAAKAEKEKLIPKMVGNDEIMKQVEAVQAILERSELQGDWAIYYKAIMYPHDSDEYRKGLTEAADAFGAFVTAYEEKLLMLWGRYAQGLAYKALGRYEDAQADFKKVIDVVQEQTDPDMLATLQPHMATNQVEYAEVSSDLGEFDKAVAMLDDALANNPAVAANARQKAQVIYTKGLVLGKKAAKLKKDGDAGFAEVYGEAVKALEPLVAAEGWYTRESSELIAQYVEASGQRGTLTPASRLTLAESLLRKGNFDEAIPELRSLSGLVDAKRDSETAYRVQLDLSEALRLTGKYDQAIVEYEKLLKEFKGVVEDAKLAKAGLQLAWTYSQRAHASRTNKEYAQAYLDSLARLAKEFPDTPEGADARYFYAEVMRGRTGRSPEAYVKTADLYAAVKPDSKYYWKSRYLEGYCYYQAYKLKPGKPGEKDKEAEKLLETALAKLQAVIDNMARAKADDDWPVLAAQTLADLYVDTGQPAKAEALVDEITRKYPELALGSPQFLYVERRIFIKLEKLAKAEETVDALVKNDAPPSTILSGYLTLGDAWQKKSVALSKAGKDKEAQAAQKKAGEMFAKTLRYIADNDLKRLRWVAIAAYGVGDYDTTIKAVARVKKFYDETGRKADNELNSLFVLYVRSHQELDRWTPEVTAILKQLQDQFPKSVKIKMLTAGALQKQGDYDEALKIWDEVVNGVNPGTEEWYTGMYNRALIRFEQKRYSDALALIKRVMVLKPPTSPEWKRKFTELRAKCE